MVRHHHAKFPGHRQCGSEDIRFLALKEQDSSWSYLNSPLLLISV